MWNSGLSVYDWSDWKEFIIAWTWPRARRIAARIGDHAAEIGNRVGRKVKILLLHLDITDAAPFISDPAELVSILEQREIQVANALTPDCRKTNIQAVCQELGLPSVQAGPFGDDDELLIVKTDLNSGGEREQLLNESQRSQFCITLGRMKLPSDYFVAPRREIPADAWQDRSLVIERYISNRANRFYRIYVAMDAVVVSEVFSQDQVKRVAQHLRRNNHFLWRNEEKIFAEPHVMSKIPFDLLKMAQVFLARFHLDYGAMDLVESDTGEFYVVDVNKTPHWGSHRQQPGLIEHLRSGFSQALRNCHARA